jgi:hypothetical protein
MFLGEQEKQSNAAEFQHYKNILVAEWPTRQLHIPVLVMYSLESNH